MSKEVRKWQSHDGRLFDTQQQADHHERLTRLADVIQEDRPGFPPGESYKLAMVIDKHFEITRRGIAA